MRKKKRGPPLDAKPSIQTWMGVDFSHKDVRHFLRAFTQKKKKSLSCWGRKNQKRSWDDSAASFNLLFERLMFSIFQSYLLVFHCINEHEPLCITTVCEPLWFNLQRERERETAHIDTHSSQLHTIERREGINSERKEYRILPKSTFSQNKEDHPLFNEFITRLSILRRESWNFLCCAFTETCSTCLPERSWK